MQLRWFFGHNDESPFKDERMRQAFRYTWDIDAYNDAMNNVSAFQEAGIPVESFWDTFLSSGSWEWLVARSQERRLRGERLVLRVQPGRGEEADGGGRRTTELPNALQYGLRRSRAFQLPALLLPARGGAHRLRAGQPVVRPADQPGQLRDGVEPVPAVQGPVQRRLLAA